MNPLLPGHSGTTPEPPRNSLNTSQGTNEDDSQNDPRPEAGLFHGQMTQSSGPEDGQDRYFVSNLVKRKLIGKDFRSEDLAKLKPDASASASATAKLG